MPSARRRLFLVMGMLSFTVLSSAFASAASKNLVTPSGNIVCSAIEDSGGYGNFIACEIRNRKNSSLLQPRPANCESDMDWGSSFTVPEVGKAELNCHHGGTLPVPGALTLKYGTTFLFHGISCKSEKSNLTCRNARGHGFTISRSKQRMF